MKVQWQVTRERRFMHARVVEEAHRIAEGFAPNKRVYLMAISFVWMDFFDRPRSEARRRGRGVVGAR
jgi:hypothetical protein